MSLLLLFRTRGDAAPPTPPAAAAVWVLIAMPSRGTVYRKVQ